MFNKKFLCLFFFLCSCANTQVLEQDPQYDDYPGEWWKEMDPKEKKSWEITPDSVKAPQVVLSKRNELGVLSNFAETPFELDGKKFASVEGFWQATKYPESPSDQRKKWGKWSHSRQEVEQMVSFAAKKAGDEGSKLMKANQADWVTYKGQKLQYREGQQGPFYHLIERAMTAKLQQNSSVQKTLCATGSLELVPDHDQGENPPPAWQYHKIWMKLREKNCADGSYLSRGQK